MLFHVNIFKTAVFPVCPVTLPSKRQHAETLPFLPALVCLLALPNYKDPDKDMTPHLNLLCISILVILNNV